MRIAPSLLLLLGTASAQHADYADYQEYADDYGQEDSLYHDYAARQQEKEVTGGGYVPQRAIRSLW
jgi:hypothetical protein